MPNNGHALMIGRQELLFKGQSCIFIWSTYPGKYHFRTYKKEVLP